MEHFYKALAGENWFDYEDLYSELVNNAKSGAHFVEVGTWKGRSACYMAVEIVNSGKKIQFDCVDTWQPVATEKGIPEELYIELYGTFLQNIAPVAEYITPVRAVSWEGAALYADESLDAVFIDAAHDYESVTKDLKAWYPKVKKGGIFAGHDYRQDCGVFDAVNDFFKGRHTVTKKGPCWVVAIGKPVTFDSYRDFKGYVINLDRERSRYDVARKELTSLGFTNIERWAATDYMKEDVVTELRTLGATRLDRFYNCAEMACLLSHFRVLHHFLAGSDPYCLVFEDDVVAIPEFKMLADLTDTNYGDFDLLSFGGPYAAPDYASWKPSSVEWNTTNWEPVLEAEKNGNSCISNCCFWMAHAYLISRKGAYKLLQDYTAWGNSAEYHIPFIDVYMSSNRNIQNKLVCYRKITNPEQYSTGDRFGERFCGIMFQRKEFKSTILGA